MESGSDNSLGSPILAKQSASDGSNGSAVTGGSSKLCKLPSCVRNSAGRVLCQRKQRKCPSCSVLYSTYGAYVSRMQISAAVHIASIHSRAVGRYGLIRVMQKAGMTRLGDTLWHQYIPFRASRSSGGENFCEKQMPHIMKVPSFKSKFN